MDKIEVAEARLHDAICGYFSDNHATTTVDNARAVSNIVRNMRNYCVKNDLMPHLQLVSDNDHPQEILRKSHERIRTLSNFAKHADTDSTKQLGYSYDDGTMALMNACVDFDNLMGEMCEHDLVLLIGDPALEEKYGALTKIQALIYLFVDYAIDKTSNPAGANEALIRKDIYKDLVKDDLREWRQHEGFYLTIPNPDLLSETDKS